MVRQRTSLWDVAIGFCWPILGDIQRLFVIWLSLIADPEPVGRLPNIRE